MTIAEALISLNSFPIPDDTIEKICIDRGLAKDDPYTITIGVSEAYELASADVYFWLHGTPNVVEQAVGINQAIIIKQNFLSIANAIYNKYDDEKQTGNTYGFVGDEFND